METYRIVVPSRRRVKNMHRLLSLLPTALVCVHESEREAYAEAVPKGQLLTHPVETHLIDIRNWILDTLQEECVVQVDDDLQSVTVLGKRRSRSLKDPEAIREIIENSLRVSEDLGIGVFCWARSENSIMLDVRAQPIRFVAPMAAAFGIRGPARGRRYDAEIGTREDIDFTLQSLLADRIVYADMRFYFQHGRSFSGTGGNAGQISVEQFDGATARLKAKWGDFLSTEGSGLSKNRTVAPMSIRVRRRNPTVVDGN